MRLVSEVRVPEVTGPIPEFLPPKQLPGETAQEYVDRAEWHRARVPADVLHAPIQGHVAGSDGIKHWSKADYIGAAGSGEGGHEENEHVFADQVVPITVFKPLPKIRKRTPAERVEEVRKGLQTLAIQSYVDGVMRLPRSVCQRLVDLGVYARIEDALADTVETILQKFDIYARALLEQAPTRDLIPNVVLAPAISQAV